MAQQNVTVESVPLISRKRVEATFRAVTPSVFSPAQLNRIISKNKDDWLREVPSTARVTRAIRSGTEIPATSTSQAAILNALLTSSRLQAVLLPFPYRNETRYTWGDASTHEIIQSLDTKGYFSHYTAMHLHGLTDQIPKTVYFNVEQPASAGGGTLSQQGIERAFRGKCRVSNNVITFRELRIYKLNGANTGQLGVVPFTTDQGDKIRVTDIERTLIDAVVRPVYAGGIGEVAEAFHAAAERVSVKKLANYLRKIDYTYPYHQAIGFYIERAGAYSQSDIALMRRFPIKFDFYLNYQIKNPAYNERWRLYVPQRF